MLHVRVAARLSSSSSCKISVPAEKHGSGASSFRFRFVPCAILDFAIGASFRRGDFAPREPEFGVEFWDANFSAPNFGAEKFQGRIFWSYVSNKESPLKNSPSRNSPPKIHIKKFTPKKLRQKNSHCTSAAGPFRSIFFCPMISQKI